ncbi:MAG TPA: hypothetical protein VHQ45_03970, partial [Gemmatimonadaceae bacterium]|nr:hypothetical protein [Gemmatimonadaceae bacterium]
APLTPEPATRDAAPVTAVERAAIPDAPSDAAAIEARVSDARGAGPLARDRGRGGRARRLRAGLLLAVAGIGVTATIAVLSTRVPTAEPDSRSARSSPARTVRVLSLEWVGDSATRMAAAALVPLLASALVDVDGVRLVPDDGADSARTQAWAELQGLVLSAGGALQVQLELRRPTAGAAVTRIVATGSRDSLPALADRLALELLPSLYDTLPRSLSLASLRGTTELTALRRFLEGEVELDGGDVERAYAAFLAATEADPRFAFAWYRRAATAERTLRGADADSASAVAARLAGPLPVRERSLVEAFAASRAGDAQRAQSLYQRLVRAEWRDSEAWIQLAEIAYHMGPVHGRPVDASRDAWSQVLQIDSIEPTALTHALRLAARRRDTAATRELLRRADALPSDELSALENRILAAHAVGDATARRAAEAALDTLPDYSLFFLHAAVAGLLERPDLARPIARRLVAPSRPIAVRAQGHVALAHLAFAEGRRHEAWRELDRARALDPTMAAWARASLAAVPFVTLPPAVLDSAARALAEVPQASSAPPLSLELVADLPSAPVIHAYLTALLRSRSGPAEGEPPPLHCAEVRLPSTRALCADLRRGLDAERALHAGAPAEALRSLEAMELIVPYQLAGRSVFFARTRERWRRAELLDAAGRHGEADDWYAAVPHASRLDYVYLAVSHLRRGLARERAGDRAAARVHFGKVVSLLPAPDPEFRPLRQDAEAGLRRLPE